MDQPIPINLLDNDKKCIILSCHNCECILLNPYQRHSCGHRICGNCFKLLKLRVEKNEQLHCKNCKYLVIKSLDEYYPDNGFMRSHGTEKVKCIHPECNMKISLMNYEAHIKECQHRLVICNQCHNKKIPFHSLDAHKTTTCPLRALTCTKCNKTVTASRIDTHNILACALPDYILEESNTLVTADETIPITGAEFYQRLLTSNPENLCRLLICYDKQFSELFQLPKGYEELKQAYIVLLREVQTLRYNLAAKSTEIIAMQSIVDDLKHVSYNGVMLWRIDNWSNVMKESAEGHLTEVSSPIFYTSKHGFKLQLLLYPNGSLVNGVTGHYMSLYIKVLPGRYDPLIKFPFKQRVTFTLEDQDMRAPIECIITPSIQCNSSYGVDRFVKHDDLSTSSYIKNDCIFIRCLVDTSNLFHF